MKLSKLPKLTNECKIFFSKINKTKAIKQTRYYSIPKTIDWLSKDLRVTKFYKFPNKQTIDRLFASNNLSQVSKIN